MFPNTNNTNTAGQTEKKAKTKGVTFDLVQVTETTDKKTSSGPTRLGSLKQVEGWDGGGRLSVFSGLTKPGLVDAQGVKIRLSLVSRPDASTF